eukprot:6479760-Amphidinium_carterae.2
MTSSLSHEIVVEAFYQYVLAYVVVAYYYEPYDYYGTKDLSCPRSNKSNSALGTRPGRQRSCPHLLVCISVVKLFGRSEGCQDMECCGFLAIMQGTCNALVCSQIAVASAVVLQRSKPHQPFGRVVLTKVSVQEARIPPFALNTANECRGFMLVMLIPGHTVDQLQVFHTGSLAFGSFIITIFQ